MSHGTLHHTLLARYTFVFNELLFQHLLWLLNSIDAVKTSFPHFHEDTFGKSLEIMSSCKRGGDVCRMTSDGKNVTSHLPQVACLISTTFVAAMRHQDVEIDNFINFIINLRTSQ